MQKRSFKTYRSLISEANRDPSILKRLKESYGVKIDANPVNTQGVQYNETLSKLLQPELGNLTTEQVNIRRKKL